MKKVLLLFAFIACINANAQQWEKTLEKGDELLGTVERIKYKYVDSVMFRHLHFIAMGTIGKLG